MNDVDQAFEEGFTGKPMPVATEGHSYSPPQDNLRAAEAEMLLTPKERSIYLHHLASLSRGPYIHEDGKMSTLLGTPLERNGRHYIVPGLWDGKVLSREETALRADKEGWDRFPSYASKEESLQRLDQLHAYIEKDAMAYEEAQERRGAPSGVNSMGTAP